MWAGIAGAAINNNSQYEIAITVHDGVYSTDFASIIIPFKPGDAEGNNKVIEASILDMVRKFSAEHLCKFLGAKDISNERLPATNDKAQMQMLKNFLLIRGLLAWAAKRQSCPSGTGLCSNSSK